MTLSTRSEDPSTPDFSFNHQKNHTDRPQECPMVTLNFL